ncbi:hypothetical protein VKT23_012429 [Stygiomarasmius scandens]|uniref:Glycosyltransferase 2-like domain-containing protein n=1 Tax=Marasmiellus scandens TaxID=2682957 RepID=A0ABR1J622_9AGAR
MFRYSAWRPRPHLVFLRLSSLLSLPGLLLGFLCAQVLFSLLPPKTTAVPIHLLHVPFFTPRYILYPPLNNPFTNAIALLVTPLALPKPYFGAICSRLAQAFLLWSYMRIPTSTSSSPTKTLFVIYLLSIPALILRTLLAFIFTRSVGWAYPTLFRHWSLYESFEGWGPGIIMWLYLRLMYWESGDDKDSFVGVDEKYDLHSAGTTKSFGTSTFQYFINALYLLSYPQSSWSRLSLCPNSHCGTMALTLLAVFSSIAESRPWSYATALLAAGIVILLSILKDVLQSTINSSDHTVKYMPIGRSFSGEQNRNIDLENGSNNPPASRASFDAHSNRSALFPTRSRGIKTDSHSVTTVLRTRFLRAICFTFIPLFAIYLSQLVVGLINSISGSSDYQFTPLPPSADSNIPLLEVLILSYPRPVSEEKLLTVEDVLENTIQSYIPLLDSEDTGYTNEHVRISVFTQAKEHPVFDRVRDRHNKMGSKVEFHNGWTTGANGDYEQGQYLHLAKAFEWVGSGSTSDSTVTVRKSQAEWILLAEDDFPLCDWHSYRQHADREKEMKLGHFGSGIDILSRMMWILEGGRRAAIEENDGNKMVGTRTGFIGTGGSGLIFHHTLLPVLEHLLLLHARKPSSSNPVPPDFVKRPPDVVVQDCLLGLDPLCKRALKPFSALLSSTNGITDTSVFLSTMPPSVQTDLSNLISQAEDQSVFSSTSPPTMLIPSRLLQDHLGGLLSTTPGKQGNVDKWRCGWRHAFHGRNDVGVLVV